MRISGSSAVLVALLALATVVVGGTAASVCDGVSSCGMGSCNEHLIPILSAYVCDCYPGWHRLLPIPTSAPCYIPFCPTDFTCYIPTPKFPPIGSNVTLNPCLFMDCGPEGTCVEEKDKPLRCQCKQGATNSLNDPSLPCIKGCVIGKDGCPVPRFRPLHRHRRHHRHRRPPWLHLARSVCGVCCCWPCSRLFTSYDDLTT